MTSWPPIGCHQTYTILSCLRSTPGGLSQYLHDSVSKHKVLIPLPVGRHHMPERMIRAGGGDHVLEHLHLGTLSLDTEYAEGLFVVNAHVSLKFQGTGKSVPALSPPHEGSSSLATSVLVQLAGAHLHGVLHTAGDVGFEGRPRV